MRLLFCYDGMVADDAHSIWVNAPFVDACCCRQGQLAAALDDEDAEDQEVQQLQDKLAAVKRCGKRSAHRTLLTSFFLNLVSVFAVLCKRQRFVCTYIWFVRERVASSYFTTACCQNCFISPTCIIIPLTVPLIQPPKSSSYKLLRCARRYNAAEEAAERARLMAGQY